MGNCPHQNMGQDLERKIREELIEIEHNDNQCGLRMERYIKIHVINLGTDFLQYFKSLNSIIHFDEIEKNGVDL